MEEQVRGQRASEGAFGDAWEAYSTFRGARTVFFWLLLVGLVLVQASFWVVESGAVDRALEVWQGQWRLISWQVGWQPVLEDSPARVSEALNGLVYVNLTTWNYVLTFVAVLYCLSLLIGMKLALVGRLGGLREHGRAFFLSLTVMVLVVPWQQAIQRELFGAMFSYRQLVEGYLQAGEATSTVEQVGYYFRFVGMWAVTIVLLVLAQIRSWLGARGVRAGLEGASRGGQKEGEAGLGVVDL